MTSGSLPSLIVVTGATGTGKSSLAVELALALNGEIINADSVQFYRGVEVGAASPEPELLSCVAHHGYSVLDPVEEMNAGIFVQFADNVIKEIHSRKSLPILVGGTGLYIQALLHGLVKIDLDPKAARGMLKELERRIKSELQSHDVELSSEEYEERFRARMLAELELRDKVTALSLGPRDISRIRRALEVVLATGESLAGKHEPGAFRPPRYNALVIAILPEREILYPLLDKRIDTMLEGGIIDEVGGLPADSKVLEALGFRHVRDYLAGKSDYFEMQRTFKRDTRHYAKRQYTWWRNQPRKLGWKLLPALNSGVLQGDNRELDCSRSCAKKELVALGEAFRDSAGHYFGDCSVGEAVGYVEVTRLISPVLE